MAEAPDQKLFAGAASDAETSAAASTAVAQGKEFAQETLAMFTRSKMFANACLLGVAGFFGMWSALSLQLQSAIISGYVLFFAILLCAFSLGAGQDTMQRWFGFVYTPNGQLLLLLVAGNLAWGTGTLGIVAAIATNAHAAHSWYTARLASPGDARKPETTDVAGAGRLTEQPDEADNADGAAPARNGWIAAADGAQR